MYNGQRENRRKQQYYINDQQSESLFEKGRGRSQRYVNYVDDIPSVQRFSNGQERNEDDEDDGDDDAEDDDIIEKRSKYVENLAVTQKKYDNIRKRHLFPSGK